VKLIYALWGEELPRRLRAESLRARLAALGASELQLNLDDADVAPAMLRQSTYDRPIAAIVTVRIPDGHAAVTELLAESAQRLCGWLVEERIPLPPPVVADGVRADALANIALLRIPESMTREEWLRYWRDHHTAVAIETQATFGYVQNTVSEPITPGAPVDAVVEELFPMAAMTDPHAFYGSGGDDVELGRRVRRMLDSVTAFGAHSNLDLVPTSRYVYRL
jgi:hypothetical protein